MELNEWIDKYVADDKMQDELNKWDLEIAENKGYEQGVIEGIEQGAEQNKNEIAKNMLNFNVPIKDISKYTVEKTLQYENYLIEDIKNDSLPIQKKLASILNDEIEVDGNKVNINEYLISNLEEDIKEKVKELVNVLVYSKYGSLTFYYDNLFCQILNKYNNENVIDKEKIKLSIEIMNNYYDGVIGIDNFFNI